MREVTSQDYFEPVTLKDIEEAYERVKGVVKNTPLERSSSISELSGAEVYLKLENLQRGGSFKIRGAYNLLSRTRKSVVAASAGNHSQGVALASSLLGLDSLVVMPQFAPPIKMIATQKYGARVLLYGNSFDEATEKAKKIAKDEKKVFAHAFDNRYVVAGQGTVGLEIFQVMNDFDYIIVPVGGGGLIGGIATYLKENGYRGKVIGVEAENAAAMKSSLRTGKLVKLNSVATIADGIAIKSPSEFTFKIARKYVDKVVTVSDEEISSAMFTLLERGKIVSEPAGAASVAALIAGKVKVKGKKVVALISGGNADMPLLSQIIEKNLLETGREFILSFIVNNVPSEMRKAIELFSEMRLNVEDLHTELFGDDIGIGKQKITVKLKIYGNEDLSKIRKTFTELGFRIVNVRGAKF
ncbi:MAG: threonine ammonia-lyase [Candidatus Thermoplasmatota archaeon]|jgi:threonine dehydratase|nr:threonine ammonia-lyase [Candidatus Thermoplasmatota archaeon]MCL5930816.1 threonine ammonia-lyase [Candidatus Thermoplasmatota archaeon]